MGATGPSTGPAGQTGTTVVAGKTLPTYGTKEDAEKERKRNESKKRLKEAEEQNRLNRGSGGDTDPKPIIVKEDVDETKEETTQEEIIEDEEKEDEEKESEDKEYDARRTKRRGRRMTILTSPTGTGQGLVLGKPTLLGA
jgi:hypothetical protein